MQRMYHHLGLQVISVDLIITNNMEHIVQEFFKEFCIMQESIFRGMLLAK
jgi:hypothetical protein